MEVTMRGSYGVGALGVVLMTGGLSCGQSQSEEDGVLTRNEKGEVVRVEEGMEQLCESQKCEPNYLYSIHFGRSRPRPKRRKSRTTPKPKPQPEEPMPDQVEGYAHRIMNVTQAWEKTRGSSQVVVAVVDTGIDIDHPDLKNNLWVNEAEAQGQPGVDDDGNGYVDDVHGWDFVHHRPNGQDDNRHGTHCAGIIGAQDNETGSVGVAPQVKLMSLKFLSASGSGDTLAAFRAIRYAIDNGAHIISNSWGGGGHSSFLSEVIAEAIAKGIDVVAAAGNNSMSNDYFPNYPARYPGVIAVGSTDESDHMSSFSNYGFHSVMLSAPGSSIYSTVNTGRWGHLSGTSMAAPQVSGALALARALKPDASSVDLQEALCDTSKKILTDRFQCGRMDVGAFVNRVQEL